MHRSAFLDSELKLAYEAETTSAALYGKGVFTTIAVLNGEPFLWNKHWRRLAVNAATLGVDLSEFKKEAVKAALDQIIAKNNILNGRARVTFHDESPSVIWPSEGERRTSLSIITGDVRP